MHLQIAGTVTKYKTLKAESQVSDCFSDFSHSFLIAVETFDIPRNSRRYFLYLLVVCCLPLFCSDRQKKAT